MKNSNNISTKELVSLALTVAALIVGGYMLYLVGISFPIPGIKYLILTPYMSFMITFILLRFDNKKSFFYVNTTFALIMSLMSIYMGITIFAVGLVTQIILHIFPKKYPLYLYVASFVYAETIVFFAMFTSAIVMNLPLYDHLSTLHLIIIAFLGLITSVLGCIAGQVIIKRLPNKTL
jgi:hypothetical protein